MSEEMRERDVLGSRMVIAHRYRLLPTKGQHRRLSQALEQCRQLYNAGLEERIDCYRKTGRGRTYFDQTATLKEVRQDPDFARFPWMMHAFALRRLDHAYKAFFQRGGFPRFKGRGWLKTIGWAKAEGWRVRDGRFIAKGIGAIRIHLHRPISGEMRSCTIKRAGRHWYVSISCEVGCEPANDNPAIGIDLGLNHLAALSDGRIIENMRIGRRAAAEVRRRARRLARCQRGSSAYGKAKAALAAAHASIARRRDTYLHKVSRDLAHRFGTIAIEALNVRGLAKGILAKSVNDASWGKLIHMLGYKAAIAGSRLIEVDPRHTSQTCPECGEIKAKALSERVHSCPCGCVMDRDVAAAKVILLRAGIHAREALNVAGYGERAPRKAAA